MMSAFGVEHISKAWKPPSGPRINLPAPPNKQPWSKPGLERTSSPIAFYNKMVAQGTRRAPTPWGSHLKTQSKPDRPKPKPLKRLNAERSFDGKQEVTTENVARRRRAAPKLREMPL